MTGDLTLDFAPNAADDRLPNAWPTAISDTAWIRWMLRHRELRRVLPAIGPRFMIREIEGVRLFCDLTERKGPGRTILKYGAYDPLAIQLVKQALAPDRTMIDVGANMGAYSLIASRITSGPIFAFEPEPFAGSILKANLVLNGADHVQLFRYAASDRHERMQLYLNRSNHGDHRCFASGSARDAVPITAVRIDDLLEPAATRRLALIKIDVQGYELHAMRGMERILRSSSDVRILSEFEGATLREAGTDPEAYLDYLEDLGFGWRLLDSRAGKLRELSRSSLLSLGDGTLDLYFERRPRRASTA